MRLTNVCIIIIIIFTLGIKDPEGFEKKIIIIIIVFLYILLCACIHSYSFIFICSEKYDIIK